MKTINDAATSTVTKLMPKLASVIFTPVIPPIVRSAPMKADGFTEDVPWPHECLDSERSFGHYAARLYPLLEKKVWTPKGTGRLWQAFDERAGVVMDGQTGRVTFLDTKAIRPLS